MNPPIHPSDGPPDRDPATNVDGPIPDALPSDPNTTGPRQQPAASPAVPNTTGPRQHE